MTNQQILKKAIEKASKEGWDICCFNPNYHKDINEKWWYQNIFCHYREIIFSYDFAKAFFGEEIRTYKGSTNQFRWQYNLQQMVLQENPLEYIKKFL